jgi:alpha-L-fucosidase
MSAAGAADNGAGDNGAGGKGVGSRVAGGDGGEAAWTNPIIKKGYLHSPLCETTPFVFKGRLYRLESWQKYWELPGTPPPGTRFHEDCVRVWDVEADRLVSIALVNHGFASALVWNDRVYVFAANWGEGKPWRKASEIDVTSSDDLVQWTAPAAAVHAEAGENLYNVAVCRGIDRSGNDRFVLLYESDDPKYVPFTFKYLSSDDPSARRWTRVAGAFYGREKYVGGPALYFEGGTYYTLYLNDLGGAWETRITRSKDLVHWEDAPAGRPVVGFDPAHDHLPLRPPQLTERNASDVELCAWKGKTILYFCGSDQQYAGDLQWAEYDGSPRQLLEHFFEPAVSAPAPKSAPKAAPKHGD